MKRAAFLSVAMVLILLATACTAATPSPSPTATTTTTSPTPTTTTPPVVTGPVKWVLVSTGTPQAFQTAAFKEMAQLIGERTKGQLTLDVRVSAEQGFQGPELLDLYGKGVVKIGQLDGSYHLGDEPLLAMDTLPMLGGTSDYPAKMEAVRPYFQAVLDKRNIKLLLMWDFPSLLWETKPINTIDDFKGRKIRVIAAPTADFLAKLGADSVTMDAPDIFQALSTGMLTGTVFSASGGKAFSIDGATKYLYLSPPLSGMFAALVVNKDAFNSLPADVQKVLVDTAREYEPKFMTNFTVVSSGLRAALAAKVTVVENLDPQLVQQMTKAAYSVWDDWVAKYPSTKPALDAILAALKISR